MLDIIFLVAGAYVLLFLVWIFLKDNSIADIFWGLGFILIAWYTFFLRQDFFIYQAIITWLVTLWWIRLALYITSKKLKKKWEDFRYKEWREQWQYFYTRSFFQIYILQGLLLLVVALPIIIANLENSNPWNIYFTIIWASVALFWLIFETIADLQLSQFMKTKKVWEIFTWGLYAYSRHPNYFWESVFWLGISIIAFPINEISILSFILITYLLLFVSWVPMLEKKYAGNPAFEAYKRKVSVFIPWRKA